MFVLLLVSVTIAAWDGSDEKSSRRILDVPDSFSFLATVSPCLWGSIPPARILYTLCLYLFEWQEECKMAKCQLARYSFNFRCYERRNVQEQVHMGPWELTMSYISQLCICDITLEAGNQPLEVGTAQKAANATSQGLISSMLHDLKTQVL